MKSHECCINVVNTLLRKTLGRLDVYTQIEFMKKFHIQLPPDYGKPSNIIYPDEEASLAPDETEFPES